MRMRLPSWPNTVASPGKQLRSHAGQGGEGRAAGVRQLSGLRWPLPLATALALACIHVVRPGAPATHACRPRHPPVRSPPPPPTPSPSHQPLLRDPRTPTQSHSQRGPYQGVGVGQVLAGGLVHVAEACRQVELAVADGAGVGALLGVFGVEVLAGVLCHSQQGRSEESGNSLRRQGPQAVGQRRRLRPMNSSRPCRAAYRAHHVSSVLLALRQAVKLWGCK